MYAIPKIHKKPWKGRPICPGYSLPQNPASKMLSMIVRPFINKCPWVIQGSKDFVIKLQDVKLPAGKKVWIVAADVVAFYPSIPVNAANNCLYDFAVNELVPDDVAKGIIHDHPYYRETHELYYQRLFTIALKEPVMTYLDKIYVQHKGLPMGAAGSPDIANIYGYHHEKKWISQLSSDVLFYGRYLDDIFTIVCAESPDKAAAKVSPITLGEVNLLWEQPTLSANFLDLHIKIREGEIHHTPFTKAGSHRERIPWDSGHPLDVKKGTFSSEISRLAMLCSTYGDYINFCEEAVSLYIGRGYPPALVSSWLKSQQKKRWEDRITVKSTDPDDGGSSLFSMKTYFNEAWKYVNVYEMEKIIKSRWSEGLPPHPPTLGKRRRERITLPSQGKGSKNIEGLDGWMLAKYRLSAFLGVR